MFSVTFIFAIKSFIMVRTYHFPSVKQLYHNHQISREKKEKIESSAYAFNVL